VWVWGVVCLLDKIGLPPFRLVRICVGLLVLALFPLGREDEEEAFEVRRDCLEGRDEEVEVRGVEDEEGGSE